jgi:hypothetical protein
VSSVLDYLQEASQAGLVQVYMYIYNICVYVCMNNVCLYARACVCVCMHLCVYSMHIVYGSMYVCMYVRMCVISVQVHRNTYV